MKWGHAILTSPNKTKLPYIYMKLFVDCAKEILAGGLGTQNTGKWWVSYFGLVFFSSIISKPGVTDSLKPGRAHQLQTEMVTKAALSFWSEEQEIEALWDRKWSSFLFLFACFVFVPFHLSLQASAAVWLFYLFVSSKAAGILSALLCAHDR